MKSPEDIEKLLQDFGRAWPDGGSIVERVVQKIETPPPVAASKPRRVLMKALIGIAASLALLAASWWAIEGGRTSLYAQVIDGMHRAQTLHIIRYAQGIRGSQQEKMSESWFKRRRGFRSESGTQKDTSVYIDNEEHVWKFITGRNVVIRSRSRGSIGKASEDLFAKIDQHARELQDHCRRYPEGDQTFDGQPCQAYVVTKVDQHDHLRLPLKLGDFQVLHYLDQQSRLVRTEMREREGTGWRTTTLIVYRYDEPLDPAIFQPNFGKNIRIVDADEERAKAEQAAKRTMPAGPVFVCEIEPQSGPAGVAASDMEALLKVFDRRLNGGTDKLAVVRKLDDRRIEVTLRRRNAADQARVLRQLARPGTLEFRILANNHVDKALIDRAQKDLTKAEVRDGSGKRMAWWVPLRVGTENSMNHPDIVRRVRKLDRHEVTEILVVSDPYNVTGIYITGAKLDFDWLGHPALAFRLNDAGGNLFSKLSGDHLPNKSAGVTYKLGIIFDGQLFSAPAIQSKIYDRGEITGGFTMEDVSDLAATLNAGSLPVQLRMVVRHPQR
jgi:hypothetical protein